jgi:hypothetical protein
MTTELATTDPAAHAAGQLAYAKALADSNLLPTQYRKQPANLLYAMAYAEALGIPTINALTSVHIVEGKPSPSADLMVALSRRAGHRVRILESTAERCTVEIVRADDPEAPFAVTWTIEQARTAGLTGKDVWKKYPRAMLRSRAESECVRQACSEVLAGMVYTPEGLNADTDETGKPTKYAAGPISPRSGAAGLGDVLGTTEKPGADVYVVDPKIIDPDLARQIAESADLDELRDLHRAVEGSPARDAIRAAIEARVVEIKAEPTA